MTTDVLSIANRSEVVATRRGYALLALGLILPGSAQAIMKRRVGSFAIKLWVVVVLAALVTLVVALLLPSFVAGLLGNSVVVLLVCGLACLVGLFWVGLTVSTWWLSQPRRMGARKGVIFSVVAVLLAAAMMSGTVFVGSAAWSVSGAAWKALRPGGDPNAKKGRYNILLLGSDAGPGREGMRPDSITLASINAATGRTVLFSLPRNLENIPFPKGTPMHDAYPNGYRCNDDTCLLNAVYLAGTEVARKDPSHPNIEDAGFQAMVDGVSGATGLEINYYVSIDMQGLANLIDALGGVTLDVLKRVPAELGFAAIEVGPNQHLNGKQTLWFARERHSGSDYDRMQRQKCVMAAMLKQLNPQTVLTKFTALMGASGDAARTSIPSSEFPVLINLALEAKKLPMASVAFTPPTIEPGDPDYDLIRSMVADAIAASEQLDAQAKNPNAGSPSPSTPGGPSTKPPGNSTQDLDKVCSA